MTLATLIDLPYTAALAEWGDPELAAVATAATVNDILAGRHALA